jgi:large subunit ribosomal protein L13
MQTKFVAKEDTERNWWIIDAADQRVGRIATQIATLLRGKHKPTFTPNQDNGDFVVVINTAKLEMTGAKWQDKKYYRHSRFFGSMKEKTAEQKRIEDPNFILIDAVKGMLPDARLSYSLLDKMKTFPGSEHTHATQKPQPWTTPKRNKK